jgi:hypothetical protein
MEESLYEKTARELEALRLDAERYRWLRGSFDKPCDYVVIRNEWREAGVKRFADLSLDDAIDKELAKKGQK